MPLQLLQLLVVDQLLIPAQLLLQPQLQIVVSQVFKYLVGQVLQVPSFTISAPAVAVGVNTIKVDSIENIQVGDTISGTNIP